MAKRIHRNRDDGDRRTLAQIEADVFLDLLRGRVPTINPSPTTMDPAAPDARAETRTNADADAGAGAADTSADADTPVDLDDPGDGGDCAETGDEQLVAKVELVAELETWLRLADKAGELSGLGAITPKVIDDIKNAAAGGFEYCRTVTLNGKVVYHQASSRRYKPTTAQRRLIQAMHRTCSQPGCSRPAVQCDLDHVVEHRLGGPSCACNLAPLCRRHHRAKHDGGWFWTQNDPGKLTVQSPFGHTYAVEPEPPPGAEPSATTTQLAKNPAHAPF